MEEDFIKEHKAELTTYQRGYYDGDLACAKALLQAFDMVKVAEMAGLTLKE